MGSGCRHRGRTGNWRTRALRLLLGWALLVGVHTPGLAAEIQVLLADAAPHYLAAAERLREHLKRLKPGVSVRVHTGAKLSAATWAETDILVTVGAEALTTLRAAHPERVALHLFITRDFWLDRQTRDPDLARQPGLALDQPPEHLVALARTLLPEARTLAVVLGPLARRNLEVVQTTALGLGFEPAIAVLSARDNPLAVLSPLVADADAILVLPDRAEFNGPLAKWVLQLGFRARVPVLAFSRAYADAGALAAVFTAPDDVGREGAELLANWLDTGHYPQGIQYPRAYSVATNPAVASALGVEPPAAAVIAQRLGTTLRRLQ
ncbi:MAG: hypothetical protein AMXMBFR26_11800 [Porticoccaceae bacterium]